MKSNPAFLKSNVFRTLFLVLLYLAVPLQPLSAQLTLSTPRTTLGTVIKQIESQSKYQFFYNDKLVTVAVEPLKVKNVPLEGILKILLKNKNISYKVEDNIVYLSENVGQQPQQQRTGKERKLTGVVVDQSGEPVIGASVLVKGTTTGGITDIDGKFSITTNLERPVLEFSYVGYKTVLRTVTDQNPLKVVLVEDSKVMDEVVVTALGIKRAQKALSYNVQQVSEDELLRNKDANFMNALSGKVAGVTINSSSSGVGGATKVVMRGSKSIGKSNNAIYVIDGVPMYNNAGEGGKEFDSSGVTESIADINPEDIESISVLTGAAAAALYGSEAANGAVVINTKKGQAGSLKLTLSQSTDFLSPFRMPEFQNRYGTGVIGSDVANVDKSWGKRLNDANYRGYSPAKDFLQTGVVTSENLTLSTGTEKNQTFLSAGIVHSDGMVPNNDYNRYNFSMRNTTSLLKDKLKIDLGASYIKQSDMNMVNQGTYSNPLVTAYLFPRGDDWAEIQMYERYNTVRKIYTQYWEQGMDDFAGQNPYWIAYRNLRENKKSRYMFNAGASYQILSWLSASGRVRVDNAVTKFTEKYYASTNTLRTEGSTNGLYGITSSEYNQTYADFLVTMNKMFKDIVSVQVNLGTSLADTYSDLVGVKGAIDEDLGLANHFTVQDMTPKNHAFQGGYHDQTQSVFGSAEIGYRSTYYLTATGRYDWASQLAGPHSNQPGFFYPSVGLSAVLSQAFKLPKEISYLKVRASYASVGTPYPRFLAHETFAWGGSKWSSITQYPISELFPERTNSYEVGLTARFLEDFNLDLSYYNTLTKNQTFDPQISPGSGYTKMYLQTGRVRNQGIEASLGYSHTWKNGFRWSSNVTVSANKNKIEELADHFINPQTGEESAINRLDIGGLNAVRFILNKGGSLGDLYTQQDMLRDSNGNIYIDADGKVSVNKNVNKDLFLGNVFPKANLSWRNDLSWKNFTLAFLLTARIGGVVYSATQANLDFYGVSESTAVARDNGGVWVNGTDLVNAYNWYSVVAASGGVPQYYIYDATNIRLQEASLAYTFPKRSLWGVADLTVSVTGRNLLMLYCKAPFDPESVASTGNYYQGMDNFIMPAMRNLGFSVRVNF